MVKLNMTQKDGVLTIEDKYSREIFYQYDFNLIDYRDVSAVAIANHFAELLHDSFNCKCGSAELHDLNDTRSYYGTFFEWLSN